MIWYKVRIRYRTLDREKNQYKTVTELFVHRAVTISEAEFKIKQEMADRLKDFTVKAVNEYALSDTALHHVFDSDQQTEPDPWYLCKVEYAGFKEKILITATSVVEAHQRLEKHLKKSMISFTIKDIDSTTILGIFDLDNEALLTDYRNRISWMDTQQIKGATKPKHGKHPNQLDVFSSETTPINPTRFN